MSAVKDAVSSFGLHKILRFEAKEGWHELMSELTLETGVKVVLGLFGVYFGTRVIWRWIKKQRKKGHLTRLRRKKQEERRRAFEKMEQQIMKSNMTAGQCEAITKLSATDLLDQIRSGQLTAGQALTAYQMKALQVHRKTNCLVEPILEAEEWARKLDRSDHRGPLHGLPVSIKDNLAVEGYDSTIGCSKFIDQPFEKDSVLVQVLKHQGAIPFVKTNIPQTMLSFETTNPIFGLTSNPYNPKRGPGGSSGGEGALIAGGGSLCGIGSDVGGSIRIPGGFCGVPAFKPTAERMSKKGGQGLLGGKNIPSTYGPLARDVEGLVLLMKAILVPEMYRLDPLIPVMPFRNEILNEKRSLKIGYFVYNGLFEAVPAMVRAVEEAKTWLEESGHELVVWKFPWQKTVELWLRCMFADGGKELGSMIDGDATDDAIGLVQKTISLPKAIRKLASILLKPFKPDLSVGLWGTCGFKNISEYWEAIKEIKSIKNAVIESWREHGLDAVLCPAFGCPAVSKGLPRLISATGTYSEVFNVIDFPAGCIPVTMVTEEDEAGMDNYPSMESPNDGHKILKRDMRGTVGLPVSVQVVTLPWQDELCLRIMHDLEQLARSHSTLA